MSERTDSLLRSLGAVSVRIRQAEESLTSARRARDDLVVKLREVGLSEREIARECGVSGPAVHYMLKRARDRVTAQNQEERAT